MTLEEKEYDLTAHQLITTQQKAQQFHYFLFINSKSGDLAGKQMINGSPEIISFRHGQILSHFYILDLYCQSKRKNGFQKAHQLCSKGLNVRIIMCGGDGTVEWILEEAVQNKINLDQIVFGALPIGTGNDFAKSIGWKKVQFSGKLSQLKKLSLDFSKMKISCYDVWQCEINCQDTGTMTQIKNGQQIVLSQRRLTRNFTNYFGIGTDARITYFNQKLNPVGVTTKKVGYAISGFLSFSSYWEKTHLGSQICLKKNKLEQNQPKNQTFQLKSPQQVQQTIEQTHLDEENYENIQISENHQCLTFLNSTVSMQLKNIWKTPSPSSSSSKQNKQQFKEQKVDDGMIQLVSYRNQTSLLLERCFDMAKKVTQGKGPFKIHFNHPNSKQAHYIHINGQAYKMNGLQWIVIRPSPNFSNSKIKILSFNAVQ